MFTSVTLWMVAHQALCPWNSPGKNTGVGCHALLQGILPTQGLIPGNLTKVIQLVDGLGWMVSSTQDSALRTLVGCPGHARPSQCPRRRKCSLCDMPRSQGEGGPIGGMGTGGALAPWLLGLGPSSKPGHCNLLLLSQTEASVCVCVSRSVMSDSLRPHGM